MSDPTAIPTAIVVAVLAIPVVVVVALGAIAGRKMTAKPILYRCRRCELSFQRPPHASFPGACPKCHAVDWNVG